MTSPRDLFKDSIRPKSADPVSVTLFQAAPYQQTLAKKLASEGMLRQLINFTPKLEVQEPHGDGMLQPRTDFPFFRLTRRLLWGVWSRLPKRLYMRPPVTFTVWFADRLVSSWVPPCRIFHGHTALSLASLRTAKQGGATTLIEIAACHPRHWKNVDLEECRRFGVNSHDSSGNLAERLIRRMELEFATCDRIVVPSAIARQSFVERGFQEKTVVVQTGVDADFFSPATIASSSATFKVCFVGRLEFAKGVGYLLEAWKRLRLPRAELVLVGELKPQIEPMLKNYGGPSVSLTGFLPPQQVAQRYRESNLFIQPSPNEGLAQVLLEAMASGLPVVATDRTGAADCITDGREGWKIPARSVDALADAILWCYRHPAETQAMGRLARARIESQFTLEHYNRRVLALYQEIVGLDSKPTEWPSG